MQEWGYSKVHFFFIFLKSLNKTTYQDHAEQTFLKKDFEEQIPRKPMMNMNTLEHAHIDR